MAFGFNTFIEYLEGMGVADVLLPFLLIFTIVYAVLSKTDILGKENENKGINVIIALVLGLSVVIPHVTNSYPAGADVVDMLNVALPQISLIAVAMVMLLILVNIMGNDWTKSSISGWMALVASIAVLTIFGGVAGWWETNWIYNIFGEDAVSLALMLLVFGVIIWFITKEPAKADNSDFLTKIGDFFAGK